MSTFCPHLDEIPDMFTTFWQRLHSAVLQLETLAITVSFLAVLSGQKEGAPN